MATITLPFAASATKRAPDADELADGYGCGPADLELFDWLAWWSTGQLAAAIDAGGLTVDDTILPRLAQAIQSGKSTYAVASGTANAWVVAPNLAVPAYAAGRVLNIIAPATNTLTTVTMNVSTLGTRSIKKSDGSDPAIADLVSGRVYPTIDDGTNIRILTPLPSDAQAAVNTMPIFPAIAGSGAFTVTAGTGSISVASGQTWTWRGIRSFNTSDFASGDRTLATVASKVYHLVWDAPGTGLATPTSSYPLGRFGLIDRTSVTETDPQYDTTYDRMLVARVITDSSNVATITTLTNLVHLTHTANTLAGTGVSGGSGVDTLFTLNWSRQPQPVLRGYFKPADANYYSTTINFAAGAPTRYGFGIRSIAIRVTDSFVGGFATTYYSEA